MTGTIGPSEVAKSPVPICQPLRTGKYRFGPGLNEHVHFHVCVVDGVFEEVPGEVDANAPAAGVICHPATGIDEMTVAQVQADLRRRILRASALAEVLRPPSDCHG